MKSYFFIPANRLHKISEIEFLGVNDIIIDIEDSVKQSEIYQFLEILNTDRNYTKYFIRVNILDDNYNLNLNDFNALAQIGFTRFVIPKIQDAVQVTNFFDFIGDRTFQFVFLVETPRFFIELKEILNTFSSKIHGIGLGSHDLLSLIGAKHTMNNLEFVRQSLLYTVKAFDLEIIDFASMNIKNEDLFLNELKDSFEKGYDSKFFIHPWQLECLNNTEFYSQYDLEWAKPIYDALQELEFNSQEFNAIKIGGEIVEKPHINRALKIMEYFNKKYES